jgi:hypothetical protein
MIQIKRKTKDTTMLEQLQNPIEKYVERGKNDTSNTQIHNHSLVWGVGTSSSTRKVKIPKGVIIRSCQSNDN